MTIFLSGKVTGDPDYIGKFDRARWELLPYAEAVLSPAVLPAEGFSHAAYLRITAAMLSECDGVYMLPDWQESAGSRQELKLAKRLGKRVFFSVEEARKAR